MPVGMGPMGPQAMVRARGPDRALHKAQAMGWSGAQSRRAEHGAHEEPVLAGKVP